jgi:hypothetical protein
VDRRTLTVLALGLLSVLAIGLVAGTLTSTFDPGAGSPDSPEESDEGGGGDGDSSGHGVLDDRSVPDWVVLLIGLVCGAGVIGFVLAYPRAGAALVALLGLLLVAALFAPPLEFQGEQPEENESALVEYNETQSEQQGDSSPSGSLLLVLAGFVGALILALGLVLRWPRGEGEQVTTDEPDGEADAAALGEIAGQAADRIESDTPGDGENEVYRAWREMTARLDTETPETTTPREFQQAAVDAGMAPDDVRELTGLFEQVRYGGEAATADREERAVQVLRRIESTYGEAS